MDRPTPLLKDDPCAAPDVRTDVRPNADGPPAEVSVGIRMADLTEINDVAQTLPATAVLFSHGTHVTTVSPG